MTIDEINTIRLALDTPEHNRHYVKHVTDAKMILNKEQEAINYSQCCTELMRDNLLKSREETARIREATAIQQTLEIYCDLEELPTVDEVLERIGRKH